MKQNNKTLYDIQFNQLNNIASLDDDNIPPFEDVVKAQKIWLKKTRLQMILRFSLSCVAAVTIAFLGLNLIKNKPKQNSITLTPNKVIVKDTSIIKVPVDEWNIPYQRFAINADSISVIKMPSGTSLTIEPNSLVDSLGQLVKGKVDIVCREFFDPVDILVAGIPMLYDSAGIKYTLETAGMIEINGSQNNLPVKIAEGKSITIAQKSFGDNTYNTYCLDTKTGQWKYQGRPENNLPEIISEQEKTKSVINLSNKNSDKENITIRTTLSAPKLQDESNPCFRLDVDKDYFPELAIYNNVLFEIKPGQGFNSTNEEWDWIDLKPGNRPNEYKVFLHDKGRTISAIVTPVFKDGEDYNKALKAFKKYEKTELNKVAKDKRYQAEKEQKMLRQAMIAERNNLKNKKSKLDYNSVIRTFTVSEFGFWNTDHPFQFASPQSKQIKVDFGLNKVFLSQLYQLEMNSNVLMVNSSIDINTFDIKFDASGQNLLFAIIPGSKKMAIIYPNEFAKQINNQSMLIMKISDEEFKNTEDLKNFILYENSRRGVKR